MATENVHFLQKVSYHQEKITNEAADLLQKKLKTLLKDLGAEHVAVRPFPSHVHIFAAVEGAEKTKIFSTLKDALYAEFKSIPWDHHLYLFPISSLSKRYIDKALEQEHRTL